MISTAQNWSKSFTELGAIRELRDGWDGDGTIAPSPAIIDSARALLQEIQQIRSAEIACPTAVAAGPTGTILFAWYSGTRYFEIELVAPLRVEWLRTEPGTPTRSGTTQDEAVKALIEWTLF